MAWNKEKAFEHLLENLEVNRLALNDGVLRTQDFNRENKADMKEFYLDMKELDMKGELTW